MIKSDVQDSTRLGEYGNGEWVTQVAVIKEGKFTRSGVQEVDEIEIFEGDENTLMMTQTYTLEFQCEYHLQKYPFDTQVKHCTLNDPINYIKVFSLFPLFKSFHVPIYVPYMYDIIVSHLFMNQNIAKCNN